MSGSRQFLTKENRIFLTHSTLINVPAFPPVNLILPFVNWFSVIPANRNACLTLST